MDADTRKRGALTSRESVASFYDGSTRLTINDGDPSDGRQAIAEIARGFFDAFPDLVEKMNHIRTSGTHAVYLWTLEGTNTDPGGTGNRVEVSGWEYWRLSDEGLIAKNGAHFDAANYEQQLAGSSVEARSTGHRKSTLAALAFSKL